MTDSDQTPPAPKAPERPHEGRGAMIIFGVLFGLCIAALGLAWLLAALMLPRAIAERREHATAEAIESLLAIQTAEARVRETDADKNGAHDFVDLATLGAVRTIDKILAGGERNGYRFEVAPATSDPTKGWWAKASPLDPESGRPYLFSNHSGAILSSPTDFEVDRATAAPPAGLEPVTPSAPAGG